MARLLILFISLGLSTSLFAQNLSGRWVGYFTITNGAEEKNYPYEITISNGNNQIINAVTVTRFSNQFTATAIARGVFTPNANLLNLQETKFEQIRLDANVQGCLMNNYLSYQNNKGKETLTGTYLAKNAVNGSDCGMGSVYLSRDILSVISKSITKNNKQIAAIKPNKKPKAISNTDDYTNKEPIIKDSIKVNTDYPKTTIASNNIEVTTEKNIKNNKVNIVKDSTFSSETTNINRLLAKSASLNGNTKSKNSSSEIVENHPHILMPWVIMSRENILVKKIITHSKTLSFDLFDNGTIDNDTITIYDNKILMLDRNRLSYKAVHFDINFSDSVKEHEIILVANNLGAVPPNTALLVYKDAKQSEELFINTNFTQNARLIIQYQPPSNLVK
jgi:hypothetical protein